MPNQEEVIEQAEKEVETLTNELAVCKEAKTMSETCTNLRDFSEKAEEPFSSTHSETIAWHKTPGGGGCIIL